MKKGKHQKKRATTFFTILLLLFGTSVFFTGIILGWGLSINEQSKISIQSKMSEKKLAKKIDQLLKRNNYVGSIYIRKNNRVIFDQGYGYANNSTKQPNSPSLYYQIGSIQKAMTALLILKQVAVGNLSLDTKLAKYYPQIAGSQLISIKDLLYMRSGLHRTASPTVPMTDEEVVQFAVHNLKFTDYQTYHYEPLNFTLLTGILIKVTNQPYEKLLKNGIIDPLGLKHTKFYDQVKNSVNHALSYQMSADNDYWKPLTESETDIRNELGTGNISMSAYDLNTFFTKVLAGNLIPKNLLFSLWHENAKGHPYCGGVYCGSNYLLAQGNINRFHAVAVFKKDLKDAVVMESNIQADKKIKLPATDLRNQIYDLIEGTEQLANG